MGGILSMTGKDGTGEFGSCFCLNTCVFNGILLHLVFM